MFMSHSGYALNIEHIAVGVTEGLGIYHLCVGFDGGFESLQIIHVQNGVRDTLRAQRVGNQIIRTTIQVVGSYDVIASLHNVLQGISDGSSS